VLVWSRLHSLSFGPDLAAGWYASKSTLRLTDQAISALFQSDVTKLETYARGIFSDTTTTGAMLRWALFRCSIRRSRRHTRIPALLLGNSN